MTIGSVLAKTTGYAGLAAIKKITKKESMIIRDMDADQAMASGIIDDAWDPAKPHKI